MTVPFPSPAEPEHFRLAGRAVFLALAALAVALFWLRFEPILKRILASKPDADFRLAPIGRRIRDFVWEVLLQAKVIRERPLPGVAHALVFWAFCAFAVVTINHCLIPFGLNFLAPASMVGRAYFYLAAAFALACAVGIFGLFVRRFFLRPKWLEPLSWESGLIALLIFLLMATYLAAFFIPGSGMGGHALWWTHTLTLLFFLPVIPRTKHLHLVLSPFTIFLSRGGFSRIPPLHGEEDFGLVAGKDLTRLASLQAYSCVECGRCTEHCPANNTGKLLDPREVILGMRAYLNEFGPASEERLLGKHNSQQAVFECTTCGACEFQCPVGIEHLPVIIGLRRGAVNTGEWQNEHGAKLFLALERGSNALGLSANERDKFVEKNALPIYDGTQEYCLWLGCMGGYDPRGREIISALVQVMRHLKVTFGVLRKERCTGDPVRRLGNDLLFQQLAEANLDALKTARTRKIISICPHCVRTIQEDWKAFGAPPEVEHHSEFLARYAGQLPPALDREQDREQDRKQDQKRDQKKIVFHDPCYLGRYRGVYEEPRTVAALAGNVIDPPRSRERGFCCGAGGGLVFLGEETGERVSHARARELAGTGAEVIAAACPFCNTMFEDALKAQSANAPELLDIAQLAARGLPRNGSA